MENKPLPTELLDLYANMGFATKDLEEWEGHTRTVRSVQVSVEYTIKILEDVRNDLVNRFMTSSAKHLQYKIDELKKLLAP